MLTVYQKKWVIRSVACLFVVLCANSLRRTGDPGPLHLKVIGGLAFSLILNAALLFSLLLRGYFPEKHWARYVLACGMIPSAFGVAFLLLDYHLGLAAFSLGFHAWFIAALLGREVAAA